MTPEQIESLQSRELDAAVCAALGWTEIEDNFAGRDADGHIRHIPRWSSFPVAWHELMQTAMRRGMAPCVDGYQGVSWAVNMTRAAPHTGERVRFWAYSTDIGIALCRAFLLAHHAEAEEPTQNPSAANVESRTDTEDDSAGYTYEPPEPTFCACPCGCSLFVAREGDKCSMCREACFGDGSNR